MSSPVKQTTDRDRNRRPETRQKDSVASHDTLDLVTVGETMATFICEDATERFRVTTAGAESNVAAGVARLGCRARWISRLGDDQLGHLVHDAIVGYGVDVHVDWDPVRVSAACVKEVGPQGSRMRYYRKASAASRLDLLDLGALAAASWVHVTGVTPALSPENRAVVDQLVAVRPRAGRLSVDINYRPVLWDDPATAASVLVPLARQADVIFIGEDEALALLGSEEPSVVAAALLARPGQELVLKRGAGAATLITVNDEVSEPAQQVAVVDLTGAGDAFAAGYIAASVWGWNSHGRLRLGHFMAARVIGVLGDVSPIVDPEELAQLAESIQQTAPHTTRNPRR